MKLIASSLVALAAAVTFNQAQAGSNEPQYFSGVAALSEITVINEGVKKTYDVSPDIAKQFGMSAEGKGVSFGPISKCAPFIGELATEIKFAVSNLKATRFGTVENNWERTPVKSASSALVTIPAGSKAYGVCGPGTNTLTELSLRAPEGTGVLLVETK